MSDFALGCALFVILVIFTITVLTVAAGMLG